MQASRPPSPQYPPHVGFATSITPLPVACRVRDLSRPMPPRIGPQKITSPITIFLIADLRRFGPRIGRRSFKFSRRVRRTQIGDHGLLTQRPDSRRLPTHKLPKPTVIPRAINPRKSGRREAGRGPDPRQKARPHNKKDLRPIRVPDLRESAIKKKIRDQSNLHASPNTRRM